MTKHETRCRELADELASLMKVATLPKRYDADRVRKAKAAADAIPQVAAKLSTACETLIIEGRK